MNKLFGLFLSLILLTTIGFELDARGGHGGHGHHGGRRGGRGRRGHHGRHRARGRGYGRRGYGYGRRGYGYGGWGYGNGWGWGPAVGVGLGTTALVAGTAAANAQQPVYVTQSTIQESPDQIYVDQPEYTS